MLRLGRWNQHHWNQWDFAALGILHACRLSGPFSSSFWCPLTLRTWNILQSQHISQNRGRKRRSVMSFPTMGAILQMICTQHTHKHTNWKIPKEQYIQLPIKDRQAVSEISHSWPMIFDWLCARSKSIVLASALSQTWNPHRLHLHNTRPISGLCSSPFPF